jgi:hypothetical protein
MLSFYVGVELKTISAGGHEDKVIPIMSTQETSSHITLVPDKPPILGGTMRTVGMTSGSDSGGMAAGSEMGPKTFNALSTFYTYKTTAFCPKKGDKF